MKVIRACRDTERLRVRYRDAGGLESERTLDPHRVVATARRWYLVARTSRACRPPGRAPYGQPADAQVARSSTNAVNSSVAPGGMPSVESKASSSLLSVTASSSSFE